MRYTAVLEVPLAGISFSPTTAARRDRAHFSILLVIRDPTGSVVEKFSEDSPVFLPRTRREALKRGNAVFLRSFALAPGRYTLEAAVVDQLARRYGTERSVLEVAAAGARARGEPAVLIKRAETVAAGALAQRGSLPAGPHAPRAVAGRAARGPGRCAVALRGGLSAEGRAGRRAARVPARRGAGGPDAVAAPAAGEAGRSPFVASVPMRELRPGRYEARLLVKQAGLVTQRAARFVLEAPEEQPAPR